uniref:DUF834 domain-containing protein n=1 Tax=Oryza meridionalis TaxID=40149 RepID=A0A0E0ELC9_9ORYZ
MACWMMCVTANLVRVFWAWWWWWWWGDLQGGWRRGMDRWEALIAAAARRSEPPRSGWAEWGGGGDARATAIPSRCPPRPRPVAAGGRGEGGGRMRGRGGEEGTWKSHGGGGRGAERAGAVVAPPRAADAAGTGTGRNAVAVGGGAAEDVVVIVSGRRSVGEPTLDVSEMLLQAAEAWRSRRTQREARPDALPPRPVAADGRGGSGEGTSRARGRGEEGTTHVAVAGGLATLTHGGERDPGAAVATEEKRNGGEVGTKRGLEERAARSPPPLPLPKRRAVSAVAEGTPLFHSGAATAAAAMPTVVFVRWIRRLLLLLSLAAKLICRWKLWWMVVIQLQMCIKSSHASDENQVACKLGSLKNGVQKGAANSGELLGRKQVMAQAGECASKEEDGIRDALLPSWMWEGR